MGTSCGSPMPRVRGCSTAAWMLMARLLVGLLRAIWRGAEQTKRNTPPCGSNRPRWSGVHPRGPRCVMGPSAWWNIWQPAALMSRSCRAVSCRSRCDTTHRRLRARSRPILMSRHRRASPIPGPRWSRVSSMARACPRACIARFWPSMVQPASGQTAPPTKMMAARSGSEPPSRCWARAAAERLACVVRSPMARSSSPRASKPPWRVWWPPGGPPGRLSRQPGFNRWKSILRSSAWANSARW